VVFDTEKPEMLALAQEVRAEWVLQVSGPVALRPADMVNAKMDTGAVELRVESFKVLSQAAALPFEVDGHAKVGEEVRMQHRYLDLRRPQMQRSLAARHRVVHAIRQVMDAEGFWEIETPILAKSTPEGARDYLVPSRIHHGQFYALPQSPQIFKQICMISGCDRYYQIARCFRDEDLRGDRQPEFTQLDLEMSFADPDDVFTVVEKVMKAAFQAGIGLELETPFPRLSHAEAMERFGSDKPDLRYDLELFDVTALARETEFKVFRQAAEAGGVVKGLAIPGGAALSRKELDVELLDVAKPYGAKGLAWIKFENGEYTGAPVKFIAKDKLEAIRARLGGMAGDAMAFSADSPKVANASLAAVRAHLGRKLGRVRPGEFKFAWITGFPAFEWSPEDKRWDAAHHPFTAIHPDDVDFMMKADFSPSCGLERVRSSAYDLVLNGWEMASGSVRIHDSAMQAKIFQVLRISDQDARDRFGFFLDALKFGAPPHAGIAPGVDRLVALMLGHDNIRDVIAFPKNAKAVDVMTGAPGAVEPGQLNDLGLAMKPARAP
jgi:aspartyl-tRNA synthetase